MKTSNAVEFSTQTAGSLAFRSLSTAELEALLRPFYLGLRFDDRRARFGAAVSDGSIASYCRELPSGEAVVIGCVAPDGLVAVVELHPFGERMNWHWQAGIQTTGSQSTAISSSLRPLKWDGAAAVGLS